jgi:hypothetical protein
VTKLLDSLIASGKSFQRRQIRTKYEFLKASVLLKGNARVKLDCERSLLSAGLDFRARERRGGTAVIGARDGGGHGGQLPPPNITKSKSRANVQHKSGEEWEIKKPKSPQFVGQNKGSRVIFASQSGNIRFTVGQYWLIIKRTGTNYVNFVVNLVMCGKGV